MIDDNARLMGASVIKAMIQRHDDKPIPGHWRQLQNIKNELFGTESVAIEVYPRESELIDDANIYWLHILPGTTADIIGITNIDMNRAATEAQYL